MRSFHIARKGDRNNNIFYPFSRLLTVLKWLLSSCHSVILVIVSRDFLVVYFFWFFYISRSLIVGSDCKVPLFWQEALHIRSIIVFESFRWYVSVSHMALGTFIVAIKLFVWKRKVWNFTGSFIGILCLGLVDCISGSCYISMWIKF